MAKQYQNHGLTLGDLINEGNLGLIKAAECFDETKAFKFISYAVWWIRQSILQAIAENARFLNALFTRIAINLITAYYFLHYTHFTKFVQRFYTFFTFIHLKLRYINVF